MRFIHILQNYVGSVTRFESTPSDIDVRFFFLSNKAKLNFHIRKYSEEFKKELDIDYWEISKVMNQILNGDDCSPFLFNTINSPKYVEPSELGLELIENRERLIGRPLIDGAIKYSERKLSLANGEFPLPENKTTVPHKQLYYACSDLMELYYSLSNDLVYPIKIEKNILDIKENKISHKGSIEILDDVKLKLLSLGINNKPDLEWGNKFIEDCYKQYNYK
jgi:predicted nucleotidyltransferase